MNPSYYQFIETCWYIRYNKSRNYIWKAHIVNDKYYIDTKNYLIIEAWAGFKEQLRHSQTLELKSIYEIKVVT